MPNVLSRPKPTAIALLATLSIVLLLVVVDLGGKTPSAPNYQTRPGAHTHLAPINGIAELFSTNAIVQLGTITNHNPFFTTHFQPPPPPKPPSSKKVEFTYHGFYITAEGKRLAFLTVGQSMTMVEKGTELEGKLVVDEIQHQTITLKDAAGNTHPIEFNAKKAIELPNQ